MTIPENTKLIPLTQGKFAIVDAADYDWLVQWRWFYTKRGIAVRNPPYEIRMKKISFVKSMHRLIMNAPKGMYVDHINHNPLDNRRCNLRMATHAQNNMNQRKTKGRSRYKGVCWHKKCKEWRAYIKLNGKQIYLGIFRKEKDAAKAYNKMAQELFGEFAKCNLI